MDEEARYLIVGLGNPGAAYEKTRHNVGFNIVKSFAAKHGMVFKHASHLIGDFAQGNMRPLHKSACLEKTGHFDEISISSEPAYAGRPIGGERESKDREMGVFNKHDHLCNGLNKTLLLLPATYMNSSGDAVRRCVDYFKVPLDHFMVVCDDVALPIGAIRMRTKGSSGGHNGLKSIAAHLNTEHYARLRVGVSGPKAEKLADYVLGKFSQEESKIIQDVCLKAIQALELWLTVGIARAMQAANAKVKEKEGENNG